MAAHSESRPSESASLPPQKTQEIVESLTVLTERVEECNEGTIDSVKRIARSIARKVAKLGGIAGRRGSSPSVAPRPSLSHSLDAYRPGTDVTAPISVRPNAMELLWVCGDCGQHYPRARECPEKCTACGAPKVHFYAPIED